MSLFQNSKIKTELEPHPTLRKKFSAWQTPVMTTSTLQNKSICETSLFALQIEEGLLAERTVLLDSARVSIGSGAHCTLRLEGEEIHPMHCVLEIKENEVRIRRWANNTLLNNASFDETSLSLGDQISVGPVHLSVVVNPNHTTSEIIAEVSPKVEAEVETPIETEISAEVVAQLPEAAPVEPIEQSTELLTKVLVEAEATFAPETPIETSVEAEAPVEFEMPVQGEVFVEAETTFAPETPIETEVSAEIEIPVEVEVLAETTVNPPAGSLLASLLLEESKAETETSNADASDSSETTSSFLERYANIFEEETTPVEPETTPQESLLSVETNASPVEPVASLHETAAQPVLLDEGDNGSVEDYMAHLMQRVRGEEEFQPAVKTTSPTNSSEPLSPPAVEPYTPHPEPTAEAAPATNEEVVSPLMTFDELKKSTSQEAEVEVDITAMRKLANSSAHSAIEKYSTKQSKSQAASNLLATIAAFMAAGYLITCADGIMSLHFLGGALGLCAGLFWGIQTAASVLETIRTGTFETFVQEQTVLHSTTTRKKPSPNIQSSNKNEKKESEYGFNI